MQIVVCRNPMYGTIWMKITTLDSNIVFSQTLQLDLRKKKSGKNMAWKPIHISHYTSWLRDRKHGDQYKQLLLLWNFNTLAIYLIFDILQYLRYSFQKILSLVEENAVNMWYMLPKMDDLTCKCTSFDLVLLDPYP